MLRYVRLVDVFDCHDSLVRCLLLCVYFVRSSCWSC